MTLPDNVVCKVEVVEPCDFPDKLCVEVGEKSCATPPVFNCPGRLVMPELAEKARAVETLVALLAVVLSVTVMVIKSPTRAALYLRKKIDADFAPPLIHTIRGVGYELRGRVAAGS
jgi:hypothetical protein